MPDETPQDIKHAEKLLENMAADSLLGDAPPLADAPSLDAESAAVADLPPVESPEQQLDNSVASGELGSPPPLLGEPTPMFSAAPPSEEQSQGEQEQTAKLAESADTFQQQNPNASFSELSQTDTTQAEDIRIIRDTLLALFDKLSEVFG